MPLVLALLALGSTGAAFYFATRKPDAPAMMLPGQTWTVIGLADQKKPWNTSSAPLPVGQPDPVDIVGKQLAQTLQSMGWLVVEGDWDDYQKWPTINGIIYPTFVMFVQPNKPMPVPSVPATYPLVSDWSTYFVITQLAQAPANIPAPAATMGVSSNAFP